MNRAFADWHRRLALKVHDLPLKELLAGVEDVTKVALNNNMVKFSVEGTRCSSTRHGMNEAPI